MDKDRANALVEEVERLRAALKEIRALKPQAICDTGFQSGPAALLGAAQRIAQKALSPRKSKAA